MAKKKSRSEAVEKLVEREAEGEQEETMSRVAR